LLISLTTPNSDYPILLDELKQILATLLPQDISDQSPKLVDIVAERLVLRRKIDIAATHGSCHTVAWQSMMNLARRLLCTAVS
jgi:hypothetical protein